ncbi:helix-turn-helix domain-containing protein [Omnitrophica bacterium]|nr:helix-turn-helix domain-containing protein [Candidatus Omnitrophota bacterium]
MERRYIGVKDLANYLGIKVATVYDWVYRRKLPYYKMGRLVRFDRGEIDKAIQSRRVEELD